MSAYSNSLCLASAPGDADIVDYIGDQVFRAPTSTTDSSTAATAENKIPDTPNENMLRSGSLPHTDEQFFNDALDGNEIDDSTISGHSFEAGLGGTQVDFGNHELLSDEIHGQFLADYALLVEALDALKKIDLFNLAPEEAVLRYMHGIQAVVFRIKVPFMMPLVSVDGEGRMMVEWIHT
ncbi:hypothetical protein DL95DRAFT_449413 [Leptodontidium sp. 2 PMI_412]|nr:hypothetical protein DL95DRAFT_449413 [Leptodontidium sp. 2 PMI_412]